jgi:choline kinase
MYFLKFRHNKLEKLAIKKNIVAPQKLYCVLESFVTHISMKAHTMRDARENSADENNFFSLLIG